MRKLFFLGEKLLSPLNIVFLNDGELFFLPGNCVVIKPSEVSENSAKLMEEMIGKYLDPVSWIPPSLSSMLIQIPEMLLTPILIKRSEFSKNVVHDVTMHTTTLNIDKTLLALINIWMISLGLFDFTKQVKSIYWGKKPREFL